MDEFDPIEVEIVRSHLALGKCYFAAHLRYVTERDTAKYKKQLADYWERLAAPQPGGSPVGRPKRKAADNVVRLEDTYDPADYVMVHKVYFDGMRAALREAHKRANDEWGGDTSGCICTFCSPPSKATASDNGQGSPDA